MSKPTLDDTLPLRTLNHLAGTTGPQTLGDISMALRLNSMEHLRRTLEAMNGAGLVRQRVGTTRWTTRGVERSRPALVCTITAKGRRVAADGKIPALQLPPPRQPRRLGSSDTPLRETLRARILTYLRSRRTEASVSEIVQALALPNSGDTIRHVLQALAAEGVVGERIIERLVKHQGPHGWLKARRPTRVYTLNK